MDIRDIGGATGLGGAFAAVADVVVTGGDAVFWIAGFALDQGPLLYVLLGRLVSLAPAVDWLPSSQIQTAFYVVAAVVAAVSLYRLIRRFGRSYRGKYET